MPVTITRPVDERIASEIESRLQLLTAGWSEMVAVTEVVRVTVRGNYTPKDRQIVLAVGEHVRVPELDCPGNPPAEARQITFHIHCNSSPSEKDPTPQDEYNSVLAAEVRRAICQPGNYWHTIGGLAIDAQFLDAQTMEGDGSFGGVTVPLAVTYRISENNPYEVRA